MGNVSLCTGPFRTDMSGHVKEERFVIRSITKGITYYYVPVRATCFSKECQYSSSSAISKLLPDTSSEDRPLLVFFSWLGAQPGPVAKYRDLYLQKGMDVLLVQSNVMHFLWPRWGVEYGLEVLKILEEPPFSGRTVLIHASSIGGYTFSQILTHIAEDPERHAALSQRVKGHVYDSLVVGTLEHMAVGLGKTLVPWLEGLIKNTALLYFWLFKSQTADIYKHSIQVFHSTPITAPALFFYCENDALCDPLMMEKIVELWRRRGMAVQSRKWNESIHAAHMRCHPEDYLSTLERFLGSLQKSPVKPKMIDAQVHI
ncbi:uncharacterized protein LOC110161458 [Boleophthalmus pectinirostris]|uniref:uncharacterized protein LOC110161458 n=1 Tax=Boleophthalmus pectinirostris TaxID=150288 RepID=UPI0024311B67|nr:uncharacterized protein LOC110161458 [Boleophthalmus pectinirostris]